MMVDILQLITLSLEKTHGLAVTQISTEDGISYDVEGIGPSGVFKTKVALLIVEMGKPANANRQW